MWVLCLGSHGQGSARVRDTGRVANGTGILTAQATPEAARRIWPWWLASGVGMIAVAVVALFVVDDGARLLLGAFGLALAVRGALLLRAAGALTADLAGRARGLGAAALAAGVVTLGVAIASTGADRVLLVAVPVVLLAAGAGQLSGGGSGRRGGQALLVGALLVTGLLVATGIAQDWDRAAATATVVTALAVAVFGVPLLVASVRLRSIAAQPVPAAPAGCAGCACGAGGCGA
jgi:hypothetical protein